jgi:hypothetical protein
MIALIDMVRSYSDFYPLHVNNISPCMILQSYGADNFQCLNGRPSMHHRFNFKRRAIMEGTMDKRCQIPTAWYEPPCCDMSLLPQVDRHWMCGTG